MPQLAKQLPALGDGIPASVVTLVPRSRGSTPHLTDPQDQATTRTQRTA
jgi:hypothetical protein